MCCTKSVNFTSQPLLKTLVTSNRMKPVKGEGNDCFETERTGDGIPVSNRQVRK